MSGGWSARDASSALAVRPGRAGWHSASHVASPVRRRPTVPSGSRPLRCSPWSRCGLAGCGVGEPRSIDPPGVDELEIPTPSPDPADFVRAIDNPWLPLRAGQHLALRRSSRAARSPRRSRSRVTEDTRDGRRGRPTTVVHDVVRDADGAVDRGHLRLLRPGPRRQRLVVRRGHRAFEAAAARRVLGGRRRRRPGRAGHAGDARAWATATARRTPRASPRTAPRCSALGGDPSASGPRLRRDARHHARWSRASRSTSSTQRASAWSVEEGETETVTLVSSGPRQRAASVGAAHLGAAVLAVVLDRPAPAAVRAAGSAAAGPAGA